MRTACTNTNYLKYLFININSTLVPRYIPSERYKIYAIVQVRKCVCFLVSFWVFHKSRFSTLTFRPCTLCVFFTYMCTCVYTCISIFSIILMIRSYTQSTRLLLCHETVSDSWEDYYDYEHILLLKTMHTVPWCMSCINK